MSIKKISQQIFDAQTKLQVKKIIWFFK